MSRQITATLPFADAVLVAAVDIYEYIAPKYRKAMLLITRVRGTPDQLLYEHIPRTSTPAFTGIIPSYYSLPSWPAIVDSMSRVVSHDLSASILSSFFRAIPFHRSVRKELTRSTFLESFYKELHATQGDDRPQVFDYRCWFEEGEESRPFFPGCPPRPWLNANIRQIFLEFKAEISNRVIYPRASRRHLARSTATSLGYSSMTGVDYLRHYHFTGELGTGPMELRQAWRYNDLTPRTYFSQGGTVFQASMYAQEIFNKLVDAFEVSHRRRRFDLNRLLLSDHDDVWIYDYSSFTSNCTEQKYFLSALSEFCRGTTIQVFDVRKGIMLLDLGEYLDQYNRTCNILPEFELGVALLRRCEVEPGLFIHRRAGALGVYGNLASCTVLHGLLSLNITGSTKKSSVVGDDGLIIITPYQPEEGEVDEQLRSAPSIRQSLRLFGDINDAKFAVLGPPSDPYRSQWTYLKRALTRHDNHLELWSQEHIINMAHLLPDMTATGRTIRNTSPHVIAKSIVRQTLNLFLRIHREEAKMLDDELVAICWIVRETFYSNNIPLGGSLEGFWVRQGSREHGIHDRDKVEIFFVPGPIPCIPRSDEQAYQIREDPIATLVEMRDWSELLTVPVLYPRRYAEKPTELRSRDSYLSTSTKTWKMLEDLGYVSSEAEVEEVDKEGYWRFRERLTDREWGIRYLYTCLAEPPAFLLM